MPKGKLVCIEGLDGSGKSTQLNLIRKYFDDLNKKVVYHHFPMYGHNNFSEIISKYLRGDLGTLNDLDPYFIANMYAMDRFMFKPQLEKDLKENDIVILDRYVLSNVAFQSAKYFNDDLTIKNESEYNNFIDWLYDLEFGFLDLPRPDLNLFIDCPLSIIEERIRIRNNKEERKYLQGKEDIHEKDLQFLRKVYTSYRNLIKRFADYLNIENADSSRILYSGDGKFLGYDSLSPENIFENKIRKYINQF